MISFCQYIKNKPKKWGVKVFILAESNSGYILKFESYTGKQELPDEKGATYHTVMSLLENHLGRGFCEYMDNYYSSPTLYSDLVLKGTDTMGTCVCTRTNFPKKQMNQVKLKRRNSVFLRHNDLTAVRFFEQRNVFMLSICHSKDLVKI